MSRSSNGFSFDDFGLVQYCDISSLQEKRLGILHGSPYMAMFPLSFTTAMLFPKRFTAFFRAVLCMFFMLSRVYSENQLVPADAWQARS
jgi:hypothetical protein